MPSALRLQTTVLPNHRREVTAPKLPEGARVEVIARILEQAGPPAPADARDEVLERFLAIARRRKRDAKGVRSGFFGVVSNKPDLTPFPLFKLRS